MTRPAFLLSLLLCTLFATGCVRSLHPIYTPQTVTYDDGFLGTWVESGGDNDHTRLEISPGEGNDGPGAIKSYRVVHTDKDNKSADLVGHLAKVGDLLVADLSIADEKVLPENDFFRAHLFPLHTFWVVKRDGDTLTIRALGDEWMKKLLEQKPAAIAHYKSNDDIILTAPSEELQKFLLAHANDEGMLTDAETFRREKPAATPAPSPAPASEATPKR